MEQSKQLDRVLVAIFDIANYSQGSIDDQFKNVELFIEELNNRLETMETYEPDAFSTGDGAIVSLGRECAVDKTILDNFTDFIISFMYDMGSKGLMLRAAANYSELDHIFLVNEYKAIQGNFIQVGNTINIAERILNFCDECEIIINDSYFNLLRNFSLDSKYTFERNDILTCKHGLELKTHTYVPKKEYKEILYSPSSPKHPYKKYSYFPPIKGEVLNYYMQIGLEQELDKVASCAFNAVKQVNITNNMATHSHVIEVLQQLNYDNDDEVLVFSRDDHKANFWSQRDSIAYLNRLLRIAKKYGSINQVRIRVYDSSLSDDGLWHDSGSSDSLENIHKNNTYFSLSSHHRELKRCPRLNELIFGCTISTKYKYAIIPIPDLENKDECIPDCSKIGPSLHRFIDYDAVKSPMKTIIATDKRYINSLINEYTKLLSYIRGNYDIDVETTKLT